MALFLVIGIAAAQWGLGLEAQGTPQTPGIWGGPTASTEAIRTYLASIDAQPVAVVQAQENANAPSPFTVNEIGAIAAYDSPSGAAGGMIAPVYTIKKGDTLSAIAARYGVAMTDLADANPKIRTRYLKPGDRLEIPAAGFALAVSAAKVSSSAPSQPDSVPSNYFIMPVNGFNWGILHHYNAVDIAAPCGTKVVAAADGLVVPDQNYGDGTAGWNGGYGEFVMVEHPAGDNVKTRYAHLEKVLVSIGDYVKQGDTIGLVGETGDATGCHVHFEVYGAKNPFAKY